MKKLAITLIMALLILTATAVTATEYTGDPDFQNTISNLPFIEKAKFYLTSTIGTSKQTILSNGAECSVTPSTRYPTSGTASGTTVSAQTFTATGHDGAAIQLFRTSPTGAYLGEKQILTGQTTIWPSLDPNSQYRVDIYYCDINPTCVCTGSGPSGDFTRLCSGPTSGTTYSGTPQCTEGQTLSTRDCIPDQCGIERACADYVDPSVPRCDGKTTTTTKTQCSNGIDDDSDGKIDYPSDLGCSNSFDDQESGEVTTTITTPTAGDRLQLETARPTRKNLIYGDILFVKIDLDNIQGTTDLPAYTQYLEVAVYSTKAAEHIKLIGPDSTFGAGTTFSILGRTGATPTEPCGTGEEGFIQRIVFDQPFKKGDSRTYYVQLRTPRSGDELSDGTSNFEEEGNYYVYTNLHRECGEGPSNGVTADSTPITDKVAQIEKINLYNPLTRLDYHTEYRGELCITVEGKGTNQCALGENKYLESDGGAGASTTGGEGGANEIVPTKETITQEDIDKLDILTDNEKKEFIKKFQCNTTDDCIDSKATCVATHKAETIWQKTIFQNPEYGYCMIADDELNLDFLKKAYGGIPLWIFLAAGIILLIALFGSKQKY